MTRARLSAICVATAIASVTAFRETRPDYAPVAIAADALIPRYLVDIAFAPLVQRDGACGDNHHPCNDIGFPGQCCDNDSYCYINRSGDAKCCAVGSNCPDDSNCDSARYQCVRAVTSTLASTTSVQPSVTGCCDRSCPTTSQYLCASSLGGGCCSFGAECQANGACLRTITASASAILTPVAPGCTTSQFQCDDGMGCCDDGQICTLVSNTGYCAPGAPTASGVTEETHSSNGGLSGGAKGGIAAGVIVGAGLIIATITWFCITKRTRRRESTQAGTAGASEDGSPVMTEATASPRPRPTGRGLTQDYFGTAAVPGPFTNTAATTSSTPNRSRGVNATPQDPGDIAAPIEIDSDGRSPDSNEGRTERSSPLSHPTTASPPADTIDGRFELYGSGMPLDTPLDIDSPTIPAPDRVRRGGLGARGDV